jgi:hypothetical protein
MKATPMLAAAGAATLMLAAAAVRMIAASDASFAGFPCPLDPALTCVMSGLDSPRGLAFGPEGALYVAEAGRGGANLENPEDGFCCFTGPFGGMLSYGRTGAISRFWDGHQEQIATGLPSIAMPNGNRGTGPNDISFLGRGDAYVTIGLENDPAFRDTLAAQHPEFPELAASGISFTSPRAVSGASAPTLRPTRRCTIPTAVSGTTEPRSSIATRTASSRNRVDTSSPTQVETRCCASTRAG